LAADRRTPVALAGLLRPTWVREGYRDVDQERANGAGAHIGV